MGRGHHPAFTFLIENEEHEETYLVIDSGERCPQAIPNWVGKRIETHFISLLNRHGMISFMGSPMGSPWASVPSAKFCSTLQRSLIPLRNFLKQLSTILICREY